MQRTQDLSTTCRRVNPSITGFTKLCGGETAFDTLHTVEAVNGKYTAPAFWSSVRHVLRSYCFRLGVFARWLGRGNGQESWAALAHQRLSCAPTVPQVLGAVDQRWGEQRG